MPVRDGCSSQKENYSVHSTRGGERASGQKCVCLARAGEIPLPIFWLSILVLLPLA